MRTTCAAVAAAIVLLASPITAIAAQELIVNGGFESGFASWARQEAPLSNGTFVLATGLTSPLTGFPEPGPRSGSAYAVTDAGGPGAHALSQSFTIAGPIASATLRFSLSAANRANATYIGPDLDWTTSALRQYATVDLFAGAVSGLTTGGALRNFFLGGTVAGGVVPYTDYAFDVTSLLAGPGTYTLRFAEVDNVAPFNLAVDDVSLLVVPRSAVPEPGTVLLLATGVGILAIGRRTLRRTD